MMATFDANSVETAAVSVMITIMSGEGRLLSTLSDWPSVFVRPVFYKYRKRGHTFSKPPLIRQEYTFKNKNDSAGP